MANRDVIVIGASAGGIEVLIRLLKDLPGDFPATILIVVHISPNSPSQLVQIFGRNSVVPVYQPQDGEEIRRGRIYVAPTNRHLLLEDGKMRLRVGPRENGFRPAIDPLFRSAAESAGRRTIGILLSGGPGDGIEGFAAIREAGGYTMVQDPEDALFPGMPSSVLGNGKVDTILPVRKMAAALTQLVSEPLPETEQHKKKNQFTH